MRPSSSPRIGTLHLKAAVPLKVKTEPIASSVVPSQAPIPFKVKAEPIASSVVLSQAPIPSKVKAEPVVVPSPAPRPASSEQMAVPSSRGYHYPTAALRVANRPSSSSFQQPKLLRQTKPPDAPFLLSSQTGPLNSNPIPNPNSYTTDRLPSPPRQL